ncbi:TPA: TSUP family transporter, partial [Streptococcus pneumoniae]
ISSFLGIGGGPLNVSLLMVFFSISIKEATMYSLAIIFFSQLSHLATIVVVTGLNQYHLAPVPVIFLASICGGVLGTVVSKVLPENWVRYCFKGMLFFVMGMTLYNLFHIL